LIGVGEAMHWRAPDPATLVVLPAGNRPPAPALEPVALPSDADIVLADAKDAAAPAPTRKPVVQREGKGTKSAPAVQHAPRKNWLRMNWLRTKIAIRHDDL